MTITVNIADQDSIDQRTKNVRWEHPLTRRWLSTSQAWTFEGGDALVVVGEVAGQVEGLTVLRRGDKVDVYIGSLAKAFRSEGIEIEVA